MTNAKGFIVNLIAWPLVAALVWFVLIAPALDGAGSWGADYDPVQIAREELALTKLEREAEAEARWAPWRAAVWNLTLMLVTVTAGGAVSAVLGVAAWRFFRRSELVAPDAAGRLPVGLSDLPTVASRALDAFHAARQVEAARQPVPHSVSTHYAPHEDYRYAGAGRPDAAILPADVAPVAPSLPGIIDLADVQHTPTVSSILLGLGAGGQPITVPMKSLWHVALAGPTGGGKSNIARMVVAQLQSLGAKVVIGDPKFTEYDAEANEDWRPIASRLAMEPAHSAKDIASLLRWSTGELERRLTMRRAGERITSAVFVYLDELPWIAEHVTDAAAMVGEIVRVGRGVGLFMLAGTQDMLVSTVGMSGARDQFRTGFYLGGDRKTGSILLDLPQRDVPEPEGVGLAWLRSAATTPPQQVRVPYASNRAIYKLLGDDAPRIDFGPTSRGAAPEVALKSREVGVKSDFEVASTASASLEATRALVMFRSGMNVPDIAVAMHLTKSTSGATAQKANAQVQAWLREALKGGM